MTFYVLLIFLELSSKCIATSLFTSDIFWRKVLNSNQFTATGKQTPRGVCCCIRNCDQQQVKSKNQLTQEKVDFSAEKHTFQLTFPALWFGALPIPQHTAAYKAALCTLGLSWPQNYPPKTNELSSCRWKHLKTMLWAKGTAMKLCCQRHSAVKGCEGNTVRSEKYKVEVESFKPA